MTKVYILYEDESYENEKTIIYTSLDLNILEKIKDELIRNYSVCQNILMTYHKELENYEPRKIPFPPNKKENPELYVEWTKVATDIRNENINHNDLIINRICNQFNLSKEEFGIIKCFGSKKIEYYIEEHDLI